ncbi:MAG: hypothetical protein KF873_00075 [Gemmataceae bacterium]|nr:hypothetical protein [Gemmataceae bacterium]
MAILADTKRQLTRQTTLAEIADRWGVDSFTGRPRDRWLSLKNEIEILLAENGELWEWETEGLRNFAGEYGLAVVRQGVAFKVWPIGRS